MAISKLGSIISDTLFFGMVALSYPSYIAVDLVKTIREDKTNLLVEVSRIADTDQRGGTTHNEWAKVYQDLSLHYDVHLSNPRKDLSIGQLSQYVNKYNSDSR